MREHEYAVELPHAAARLWSLFQRYDLWKEYAPAVLDVEIVYPGDANGNGLLRVAAEYLRMKEDRAYRPRPRSYLFGGKAAPGYAAAKAIIKLINSVGDV